MRGLFLSFSRPSPIVLVGLLVFSTHFLWAQRTSPLGKIPIQLLDTPAPFASVSEVLTPLHLTYRRLPLTFEQNQGQSDSTDEMFPYHAGDYRLPTLVCALFLAQGIGRRSYSREIRDLILPGTYIQGLREHGRLFKNAKVAVVLVK
jgi:hypothetical protein